MKPYPLTSEDRIHLVNVELGRMSMEELGLPPRLVKKMRKDIKLERRAEIHSTRAKSKANIKKQVQNYIDNGS